MVTYSKAYLALFLFAFFSTSAMAENVSRWNSSLVLSAGQSRMNNACTSPWVTAYSGLTCNEKDTAYSLAYIYHFNKNWGVEISGVDFGHAKATGTLTSAPSPLVSPADYTWRLHATGVAIAGVGTMHLGDSISLFGKAGLVRVRISEEPLFLDATKKSYIGVSYNKVETTNRSMFNMTYGAGVQYNFNRDFAFRVQYENFGSYDIYSAYNVGADEKVSISLMSAGLVLNF